MNSTVLILTDQNEFAQEIMRRWQIESRTPAFVVAGSGDWQQANHDAFNLVLAGDLETEKDSSMLSRLQNAFTAPVLYFAANTAMARQLRQVYPQLLVLARHEDWQDTAVVLGAELLKRANANSRALAEETAAAINHHAALGRFMLEVRHGFNNALSSVLGHSDLLLLDPGTLAPGVHNQIKTIHSMALRMRDIMQRFSCLDAELRLSQKDSRQEIPLPTQHFHSA